MLLVEQAHDEVADREEEDERLLAVHEDPAEALVARRRQSPKARRVLVERVVRMDREDVREPEERGADEAGSEIRERRRRRESPADDRPPEEQSGRDEDRVLDVEP